MAGITFERSGAAQEWLAGLGYAALHGWDICPEGPAPLRGSYDEVFLTGRFRKALARLNPSLLTEMLEGCCARFGRQKLPHSSKRTAACTAI